MGGIEGWDWMWIILGLFLDPHVPEATQGRGQAIREQFERNWWP